MEAWSWSACVKTVKEEISFTLFSLLLIFVYWRDWFNFNFFTYQGFLAYHSEGCVQVQSFIKRLLFFFTLSLLLLLTNSMVRLFVVTVAKKFIWLPVFEGPKIIFETIKEGAPEGFGGLAAPWTNGSIDVASVFIVMGFYLCLWCSARCSATKNLSLIYQILSKSEIIDILNSLILVIYTWQH